MTGTDRDTLLAEGERWFRAGQDLYVAGWAPPLETVDAFQALRLLEHVNHDTNGVHLRMHAGAIVVSLRQDVWQVVRRTPQPSASDRAHKAIEDSVREDRTVHIDGGSDEGNALYTVCFDCADTHEGGATVYSGIDKDGKAWRVHLHRVVTP